MAEHELNEADEELCKCAGYWFEERYDELIPRVAMLARAPACIARFQLACAALSDGLRLAIQGNAHLRVYNEPWMSVVLEILSEDPLKNANRPYTVADQYLIWEAFIPVSNALGDLLTVYQEEDEFRTLEEFDEFYRVINNKLLLANWGKDPETGKTGARIHDEFLVPLDSRKHLHFDESFFLALRRSTGRTGHRESFRKMEIPEDLAQIAAAMREGNSEQSEVMGQYLAFETFGMGIERFVGEFFAEPVNKFRYLLLEDDSRRNDLITPFFASYYMPFTRYFDKADKETKKQFDLRGTYERLKAQVGRIVRGVYDASKGGEHATAAKGLWEEIAALYDLRLADPLGDLNYVKQIAYRERIVELGRELAASAAEVKAGDARRAKRTESAEKKKVKRTKKEVDVTEVTEFRFSHSRDYTAFKDLKHGPPKYKIDIYRDMNSPTAKKCIKALLKGVGNQKGGWVKKPSNENWRGAFQEKFSKTLHTFKSQQIQVGNAKNGHIGEWRFIPNDRFDELSSAGPDYKRNKDKKK